MFSEVLFVPQKVTYALKTARHLQETTKQILADLPDAASEFILAIQQDTQPLTRYAYARDLSLFFRYLERENPAFGARPMISWNASEFNKITARDISLYLDYLTLYFDEDEKIITNQELGKMRKFYSVRSFFKWMYRNQMIKQNVTELVNTPKRHEKPILRLEIDEVARMLDAVETGDALTEGQRRFHNATKKRDLAILSLFLGTGIRVSECVGIDMDDLDFDVGGFLVTRKGGNQAILYFPDEVVGPLKAYLAERKTIEALPGHENALFLSLQKTRMSVRAMENMVKKYAQIAAPLKKRISPHKLRSTFGTNLYNETGDIYLVADVLGHADINTTRRHYAAMQDQHRRYAATKVRMREEAPAERPSNDAQTPASGETNSDETKRDEKS